MFGKLIKNVFNKAEELAENIQENITPSETQNNEVQNNEVSYVYDLNYTLTTSPYADYLDYSNQLPEIDRSYNNYYVAYFDAIYGGNRSKIHQSIDNWKLGIDKMIQEIIKIGDFQGDDSLVTSSIEYFQEKRQLIDQHYVKYAEAVLTDDPNQTKIYEEAEAKKTQLYDSINTILDNFRRKYENKGSDLAYLETMRQTNAFAEADAKDNPLLEPIHGISLYDYTAGVVKMGGGATEAEVFAALGVDKPQWDEAALLWAQRMEEDSNMTVMTLYGQYFSKADEHPKLGKNGQLKSGSANNSNLERLKTDEKYFYDLSAERQAAFEVGKDGAQYILDKYGINIVDFQAQAMIWNVSGNVHEMIDYQEEKYTEYLKKFQDEMGGTIADDIEF
jgi:hypothetical protein